MIGKPKLVIGDVFASATLAEAMTGCGDVYYCVVDTRAWLRDPSPLFRTNVGGARTGLAAPAGAGIDPGGGAFLDETT